LLLSQNPSVWRANYRRRLDAECVLQPSRLQLAAYAKGFLML
jgi:hypothetical protein